MRCLFGLLLSLCCHPGFADSNKSGMFDYYVMSLSWSPNWCATQARENNSEQCAPDRDLGFSLHGLWPQYERGYPSFCRTIKRAPSRRMTRSMADIMGSAGLAWHQWKKHGRCTGLSAGDYYDLSRRAYESFVRPEIFRKLDKTYQLPAHLVEEAFLEANPDLQKDEITVTCKGNAFHEVRICLDNDLQTRVCGPDMRHDCTLNKAIMHPIP